MIRRDFLGAIRDLGKEMIKAPMVRQDRWQGLWVSGRPDARCYELLDVQLKIDLAGIESLDHWRADISPNLPWADDHFAERVSGNPLNPGQEWRRWPWASSAARFRDENELFNHTYPERLWPRWARLTRGGIIDQDNLPSEDLSMSGIGWRYGDLEDLVRLLVRDPYTRQAYIPLFFPEDTGWGDGGRKPCTLGYQFIMRNDRLSMFYPMRSCDFVRHLRDDCYLGVRLLLWVLDRCRELEEGTEVWGSVTPGVYSMHMTSLHVFENDRRELL